MSNLKRLKTLLLLNSKVKLDIETSGYSATCFTKIGSEYISAMLKDKATISTENTFTSPFFSNKQDKLEYLCKKNKSLEKMVKLLQLE
jgi:hypothetical protein